MSGEINLKEIESYSNPNFDFSEINASTFAGSDDGEIVTREQQEIATKNRLRKYSKKRRGGVLRYPLEALTEHTDYLQIDIVEYKSVKQSSGSLVSNPASGGRRIQGSKVVGSTRPRGLATKALKNTGTILLPVPNSVQDGNSVDYGSSKLGSLQATAATGIRNLMDADFTKGAEFYGDQVKQSVAKAKNEFVAGVGGADKAADILKKQLTTQAVGMLGGNITIDQLMARENGEIFNPS